MCEKNLTVMMASAQAVETSVNVITTLTLTIMLHRLMILGLNNLQCEKNVDKSAKKKAPAWKYKAKLQRKKYNLRKMQLKQVP